MVDTTDPTDPNATPTTDPTPAPAPVPDPVALVTAEANARAALATAQAAVNSANTVLAGATAAEAQTNAALGVYVNTVKNIVVLNADGTATTLLADGNGAYHPVISQVVVNLVPAPAPNPAPEPPPAS